MWLIISDANKISYSSQTHYMLNTVLSILHILLHLISTTNLWSNINRIFIKILFLIGRRLLYNVVLVSVGQQHASALSIHTHTHTHIYPLPLEPPPQPPSHPSRASQSTRLSSLCAIAASHGYFTHGSVYISTLLFNPSHPFFPRCVRKCIPYLCLCLYSCPANRFINTIFLDAIYMH